MNSVIKNAGILSIAITGIGVASHIRDGEIAAALDKKGEKSAAELVRSSRADLPLAAGIAAVVFVSGLVISARQRLRERGNAPQPNVPSATCR